MILEVHAENKTDDAAGPPTNVTASITGTAKRLVALTPRRFIVSLTSLFKKLDIF